MEEGDSGDVIPAAIGGEEDHQIDSGLSMDNILDSPKEGSDTKESFISSVGESVNSYRASCMYPYPVRIPRKIVLMR
jgi:hypothetical protein